MCGKAAAGGRPHTILRGGVLRRLLNTGTVNMTTTRTDAVKLRGNPVTLAGAELKTGETAPDFKLQDTAMQEISLATSGGKTRIIATIPSLDTPVCAMETKKFNEQAGQLSNVEVLVVSMDLPFGQKRWCGAENVANVKTLMRQLRDQVRRRLRRADSGRSARPLPGPRDLRRRRRGKLKYVEYVKDISEHPNYDAVLAAAK